jgi:hypothetical protein
MELLLPELFQTPFCDSAARPPILKIDAMRILQKYHWGIQRTCALNSPSTKPM